MTAGERYIPDTITQILAGRGFKPAEMAAFLFPNYDEQLHDPFLMADMDRAVERLILAAQRDEQVVVYGDYDIDGITATTIMLEGLAANGIRATSYIPDRFEEGYGINQAALEQLQSRGARLVVSVDCGITSVAEAAWAREHGLDLIITDHHALLEILPEAVAVVNPKRPDDHYPFKELCGAAVAFKLICALQSKTGKPEAGQEKWLLDLVALGTVCDVMDLVGENRALVSYGLRVLRQTRRPGLRALALVGGIQIGEIASQQLGFVLGPRLNAAGRLEHADRALELVRTTDEARAVAIAAELDQLNTERRIQQEAIVAAALEQGIAYANEPVILVAAEDWSHGIVGIAASKLVEAWGKPVLVAQILGEITKGSARSTGSFNMVEALRLNANLLTRFGGHFYAAGFTLPTANLGAFRLGLAAAYNDGNHTAAMRLPQADLYLADLAVADWPLLEELALLEPFGAGNPQPLLAFRNLELASIAKMGTKNQHLRLSWRDEAGRTLSAVGFSMAKRHGNLQIGQHAKVLGRLGRNDWRGTSTLQLVVSDITYD